MTEEQLAFDIEAILHEARIETAPEWTGAPLHFTTDYYPPERGYCAFAMKTEQHASMADCAHCAGAVIAEGHGEREVGPIIGEGDWIKPRSAAGAPTKKADPMRGSLLTRWPRRAMAALGRSN